MKTNRYDFTDCDGLAEWNNIIGFFTLKEAIAIQKIVKQLPEGAQVAELGTFQGRSSVAIAAVLPTGGILHCIDHFEGTILRPGEEKPPTEEVVKRNLNALSAHIEHFGVKEKIRVYVERTDDAVKRFEPESLDMIFIDAGHDYDSVKNDLRHWYPKLKAGGHLICDDYEQKWPGVVQAIHNTGFKGQEIAPSLWMHIKPAQPPKP